MVLPYKPSNIYSEYIRLQIDNNIRYMRHFSPCHFLQLLQNLFDHLDLCNPHSPVSY